MFSELSGHSDVPYQISKNNLPVLKQFLKLFEKIKINSVKIKVYKCILFSGPMYSYFQRTQFLLQFLHFAIKTSQRNPKEKE